MSTLDKILFIISRIPRILLILKELWGILSGGKESDLDNFLKESEASISALKNAKNEGDRHEARKRISDLISRL